MATITNLLRLSKGGSQTAFGLLFRKVLPKTIFSAEHRRLRANFCNDPDDLAQKVMIRLWKAINDQKLKEKGGLNHSEDLARFIRFLLGKEYARALRDGTRKQRDALKTIPFDQDFEKAGADASSEMLDLVDFVAVAYAEMAPIRRAAVDLHFFEHLDISEVANRLDCDPRSISRYLKEFRMRFREKWEG